MRKQMLAVAVAAAVAVPAVAAPSALAGRPGTWDAVTKGGEQASTSQIGLARNRYGALHLAWQRQTGPLSHDLMHSAFNPGGHFASTRTIVGGWVGIGDVALALAGDDLLAFFAGQRTSSFDEPHFGLNLATSAKEAAPWSLAPASIYREDAVHARTPSVALVGGVPLQTWYGVAEPVIHAGLDASTPARTLPVSGEALNENIAAAGAGGSAVVAWCQGLSGGRGIFAQEVDPLGNPVGGALRMPGSATAYGGAEQHICPPASFRMPLAARAGGGVYVAALTGYPARNTIRLWRVGTARSRVMARGPRLGDAVALAADGSGRLWIAWGDGTTIRARRSNRAATVFGETVTVGAPRGQAALYVLDASASRDRLDLLPRFGTAGNAITLFHTQVHPGLTLRASGGKVATFRVTDAGDPVAGATVRVAGRTVTTNAAGVAATALPPGTYRVVASKAAFVPDAARVRIVRP